MKIIYAGLRGGCDCGLVGASNSHYKLFTEEKFINKSFRKQKFIDILVYYFFIYI
jgi:hypothetical protein